MPKTRKRANSPSPADISDDANGRFLNSQLLFYGFIRNNSRLHNKRSFSRNFSLVSGFCSCSSTSCSHSSWLKKEPLLLQVRSAAASQLNAFFPFFGLGFDEEKGQNFFSFSKTFKDFTRRQLWEFPRLRIAWVCVTQTHKSGMTRVVSG